MKLPALTLWTVLAAAGPVSAQADLTQDALLDMGLQTDSLQEDYSARKEGRNHGLFSLGADGMVFRNYPVITDSGTTDFSLMIGTSHLNISVNDGDRFFRGIDFSGKAVGLGKSFTFNGGTYSEVQGRVSSHELYMALFSLWNLDLDIGLSRSRSYSSFDETGLMQKNWLDALAPQILPRAQDEYGFFYTADVSRILFLDMRIRSLLETARAALAVPALLRLLEGPQVPNWMRDLKLQALWEDGRLLAGSQGAFLLEAESAGLDVQASLHGNLFAFASLPEFNLARASASIGGTFNGYFLTLTATYLRDRRLEIFQPGQDSTLGGGVSGGVRFSRQDSFSLEASYTFGLNLESYLRYMTGAFNHPTHHLTLRMSL